MNAKDFLIAKTKEVREQMEQIAIINELLDRFPDLTVVTNCWGVQRCSSPQINQVADQCDITHNSFSSESYPASLEAYPFLEIELTHPPRRARVYTSPTCYFIGEKEPGNRDVQRPGWEETMRGDNISEKVIGLIKEYFKLQEKIG